jgi:glycosyltransferase involved in cell wall biosynthesis
MNSFQVSVIIPVYNAASFVEQAVESCLAQPQTAEVVLVEDYSPDNSWEVCQSLVGRDVRIRLYRQEDGKNHGAGATRNLAIQKSSCEFIAFLDADDYFLPGRFTRASELFQADPTLEGVYDAVYIDRRDENGAKRWQAAGRSTAALITVTQPIAPEKLFASLVGGNCGSWHLDGFVFKRSLVEKIGEMDEDLPLHQDSAFMVKAAALCILRPGRLDEPVAVWRIHSNNRFSAPGPKRDAYALRLKYWHVLWMWSKKKLPPAQQELLLQSLIRDARFRSRFERQFPGLLYGLQQRLQLILLLFWFPELIREKAFLAALAFNIKFWLRQ